MAGSTAYPTTAQAMLDRLLTDREFYVRAIVTDNYPAVKGKFDQEFGLVQYSQSPAELTTYLVKLDRDFGKEATQNVLDVPFRNAANNRVLAEAMAQGEQMVRESGAGSPKSFWEDATGIGAITGGIGAIVGGVGNIINGRYIADANGRTQEAAIAAQSAAEQQKAAQRAQLIKWGIIAATTVAVLAILLVFRKR